MSLLEAGTCKVKKKGREGEELGEGVTRRIKGTSYVVEMP